MRLATVLALSSALALGFALAASLTRTASAADPAPVAAPVASEPGAAPAAPPASPSPPASTPDAAAAPAGATAAAGVNPSFPPTKNVLELFTSQGCDTCPPADQVLARYANRPNVIALTLPVDIWDYLGWKDTLASDKNSERQKYYAKARGDGAIFTPQIVVNGLASVNGNDPIAINKAIIRTDAELAGKQVPIRFWHERNSIIIETGDAPAGSTAKEATIWFAVVQKSAQVPVQRGENRGKTLTYTNIVREMMPVGSWNGKAMNLQLARASVMRPETEACIVLLQEGKAGPIIGAAWTGLW